MSYDRPAYLVRKFFQDRLTDAERIELAEYIKKNAGVADLRKLLSKSWDELDPCKEMPDEVSGRILSNLFGEETVAAVADDPASSTPAKLTSHRIYYWKYTVAAASVALLLVLSWWLTKNEKEPGQPDKAEKHSIAADFESKAQATLPDGTKIWLNAGSRIEYDNHFGEQDRRVTLSGEVFFDVAHNKEKPFLIHTSMFTVKVLGTVLNVRAYPNETHAETALISGSVEVLLEDDPNRTIQLKPAQKLTMPTRKDSLDKMSTVQRLTEPIVSSIHYHAQDSSSLETVWIKNKLVFRNKSFEELAQEMSRWFNANIEIRDTVLLTKKFTGTFETETISEALQSLSLSQHFKFSYDEPSQRYIIYR